MPDILPMQDIPREICILRLSALGDVTHTVPVIRAINAHWPQTKVTWIIGKSEHRLLQNLQGVEFIPFDKRGGVESLKKLKKQLKGRSFDVLLHMQVALRANIISRLVKAPLRLGWDRSRSRDGHHWFINHPVRPIPFQHQVNGFLEFAWSLGVPEAKPVWDLPIADSAHQWANEHLPADGPLLMISACSNHSLRNWRSEYYAQIADRASIELGMKVVLIGGPGDLDRRVANDIQQHMQSNCLDLVGKDTLAQSMALMKRASVLISPDSGPVHIASALGTPVLGLYAATWSRRSGPYNSLDLCVDRFSEAARKFRKKQPGQLRWGTRIEVPGVMDLIELDAVFEKLRQHQSGQSQTG